MFSFPIVTLSFVAFHSKPCEKEPTIDAWSLSEGTWEDGVRILSENVFPMAGDVCLIPIYYRKDIFELAYSLADQKKKMINIFSFLYFCMNLSLGLNILCLGFYRI